MIMEFEISEKHIEELEKYKNKMLLWDSKPAILRNYLVEEKMSRNFFWQKPKLTKYLVNASIQLFHPDKKYWGFIEDDAALRFLFFKNLSALRNNYELLKESLKQLNYDIVPIPKSSVPQ